jgi:signal transduction histidine kinase
MARSHGTDRARLAWFFAAFTVVVVAYALPVPRAVQLVAVGFVPVALGVAMLRHGLFGADRLLNRTVLYGTLSLAVLAVFGVSVGLATAFGGGGTGAVLAAVVVAVGLSPARTMVQRWVDRVLYGTSRDPYAALTGLGERLSAAASPEDVLPVVADAVADALRLPYVAVTADEGTAASAVRGVPTGGTQVLPLRHAGAVVGTLTVGLPDGRAHLDRPAERLLHDLARLAGAAAQAVQLTDDVRRSRDELAAARDDERHRIRRDLHDGLGPALAGVALGLGAARRALTGSDPDTEALLAELEVEVRDSLDGVRHLVDDLPPTTLETLGLEAALGQYARSVSGRSGRALAVSVHTSGRLPPLPAAVEVAAYRIALEALTNVTRHARARRCRIHLAARGGTLLVTVRDDGRGPPANAPTGLGLPSMQHRAADLGGRCSLSPLRAGGTRLAACLPLTGDRPSLHR